MHTVQSYVINKLLPQKLVDMARMIRQPAGDDSIDLFQDDPPPAPPPGAEAGQAEGRATSSWSLARKRIEGTKKAIDSLPFLSAWTKQTRKLNTQSTKTGG